MKRLYFLILIGILILATSGCHKQIFDGSKTGNDNQFILDYSVLNKTFTHKMDLKEGTKINVNINDKSGRIDVLVKNEDKKEIYRGDDASSGDFIIEIPDEGTYLFSVTGSKAKGNVSFIVQE